MTGCRRLLQACGDASCSDTNSIKWRRLLEACVWQQRAQLNLSAVCSEP